MTTVGSLFAGYGSIDLALASVFPGARTAWVSDIDKGACKVLAHRYPDAPNLDDITTVDWSQVEPVDVICGGSPCQDVSTAGKRAGMTEGTRSNLWVAMREAIAALRPSLVVWENVGGAFSAAAASEVEPCPGCVGDGSGVHLRALHRVLGDLAALGFDAEWSALRAADVGAAHGRLRVFVVAWPAAANAVGNGLSGRPSVAGRGALRGVVAEGSSADLLPTPRATDGTKGGPNQRGSSGDLMLPSAVASLLPTPRTSDTNGAGAHGEGGVDLRTAVSLLPTPTTTQRGTDANLDSRRAARANLHNAVADLLPTPAALRGGHNRSASDGAAERWSLDYVHKLLPTPTTEPATGNGHARNLGAEVTGNQWGKYAAAIARHEHTLGRLAPAPTETGPRGKPRLSCRFDEWLMGLPSGWITDVPGITHNETLRLCGNGVFPLQAEVAIRHMLTRAQVAT